MFQSSGEHWTVMKTAEEDMMNDTLEYDDNMTIIFCNQTRHQVIPELFLEKIGVLTAISVGTFLSNIAILIAILTSQSKVTVIFFKEDK